MNRMRWSQNLSMSYWLIGVLLTDHVGVVARQIHRINYIFALQGGIDSTAVSAP
jgi:hypothetical protein